jgi:hypothetical protein
LSPAPIPRRKAARHQSRQIIARFAFDITGEPGQKLHHFPPRIVPDGRRQGAAFRLVLDGKAELVECLFEHFRTNRRIRKGRIAAHAGQDLLADGKNRHGAGIPKAQPDSMEHAVDTVREQLVLRTETIGSVITIIFSGSKLIVFGRELVFLRPKIIVSSAKTIIPGTEIIMSRSNYIASLPDSIVFEAKIIMFKPKMIASKAEMIISRTTKIA